MDTQSSGRGVLARFVDGLSEALPVLVFAAGALAFNAAAFGFGLADATRSALKPFGCGIEVTALIWWAKSKYDRSRERRRR